MARYHIYNFKAPYTYGYDVNEYDEYGNPKKFSKHEEKDEYGNLKGKTTIKVNPVRSLTTYFSSELSVGSYVG